MSESATPREPQPAPSQEPRQEPPEQQPERSQEQPEAGLTTGALSRRLGVSPTTVRSWDRRYGIGPAERADGRHRRWTPRDIAVLDTMCRLTSAGLPPAEAARLARAGDGMPPVAPPSVRSRSAGPLPLGEVRQECRGLARAAVRLDAPAVEDRLAAAVEEYGVAGAWQEVMAPTLHAVGRKWASSGDRYVEVEHLLSWHVATALRRRTRPAAAQGGPATAPGGPAMAPVVLACASGEQHTLPLEALNACLTELRLPTRMFGAAVPAEALTAAVLRLGPAAVVLWSQARSTASPASARRLAGIRWGVRGARTRPLVLLGGPGWAGTRLPGTTRPGSLSDALDVLADAYGMARS
ncbi:MerR family transcriptional regulator [Streptomyces sp. YIM S03343]